MILKESLFEDLEPADDYDPVFSFAKELNKVQDAYKRNMITTSELKSKYYELRKKYGITDEDIDIIAKFIREDLLEEDLEREFTIHYSRKAFEYGWEGAVRIKASNENEAKEKFFAKKKDDKITVIYIHPTTNEDIRKGIKLLESALIESAIKGLSAPEIEERQQEINNKYSRGESLTLEDKDEMNELDFRRYANSCLVYGEYKELTPKALKQSDTLALYNISLNRALEIIEEQKEIFEKARVYHDVYTDSEGVSYSSVDWDVNETYTGKITEAMDKFDKLYDELVRIYLKPYARENGYWVKSADLDKIKQAKELADKMGVENEISKKEFTVDDEGTKKTKYILDMWFEEE